ncbi:MAG: Serine protease AprX [Planctomycetota bacterium]
MSLSPSVGARPRACAVLAALLMGPVAHAQCPTVIHVPGDAASIDEAVAMVCAETTAEIVVGPGTWGAAITSPAGSSIIVRGSGSSSTIIMPAMAGGGLVANADFSRPVRFKDCTLNGGNGDHRSTSFDHCVVQNCSANFFPEGASVVDSTFVNCGAPLYGVLYMQEQSLVARCTFEQCSRGITMWGDGGPQDQIVEDCTFTACSDYAVSVRSSCCNYGANRSRIDGCSFNNSTGGSGTGILFAASQAQGAQTPRLTIVDCTFRGMGTTAAGSAGGAIRIGSGSYAAPASDTSVTGCTFIGCRAGTGGAIYLSRNQPLTLAGCTFTGNSATAGPGGALAVQGEGNLPQFSASQCTFVGNTAAGDAGAIKLTALSGGASITGCTFQSNSAAGYGGAMNVDRIGVTLGSCLFEGNVSTGSHVLQVSGSGSSAVMTGCSIRPEEGSQLSGSPAFEVVAPAAMSLATTTICGSGVPAWLGTVTDAGGNCIVESCADGDGNGTPDACQVVSVPGDYATIQAAIDATPKGEFRTVSVAPGTYAGPIQFRGKSVLVRGAGAGATVLQGSGGTRSSVVRFNGGESSFAGLEALTVRGGSTGTPFPTNPSALVGGGVFGYESAASIRNCVIEGNASGFGGGAYLWQCTGSITGTTIRQNSASADGGGLQIYGGQVSVVDSTVTANYANSRGGGLHLVSGQPSMTRVSVIDNDSNNVAGGVSWVPVGAPTLVLDDCTVTGNVANIAEGGISSVDDGGGVKLTLNGTRVCSNVPVPNVAGGYVADASSEVCDCIADVTLDGVVNGVDLAGLLSAWGTDGGPTPRADCNRDGTVDGADLGIVLGGWGTCPE